MATKKTESPAARLLREHARKHGIPPAKLRKVLRMLPEPEDEGDDERLAERRAQIERMWSGSSGQAATTRERSEGGSAVGL